MTDSPNPFLKRDNTTKISLPPGKNLNLLNILAVLILLILTAFLSSNFNILQAKNLLERQSAKKNPAPTLTLASLSRERSGKEKIVAENNINLETINNILSTPKNPSRHSGTAEETTPQKNDDNAIINSQPVNALDKPLRKWENPEPLISADSAIAISVDSNLIFYSKNIFQKKPIASITKLMTALVAVEYLNLKDKITINDLSYLPKDGTSCYLYKGEQITVENLLYCSLVISANDSAAALSKTMPSFVALMNVKSRALGLYNTYFEEPTGISPLNKSTSYDIAKLAQYILLNEPIIFKIQRTPQITLKSSINNIERNLINFNKFVSRQDFKGGKTGYTDEASGTLVSIFELSNQNKTNIIIAVLGSANRFNDSIKILDWIKKEYIFE